MGTILAMSKLSIAARHLRNGNGTKQTHHLAGDDPRGCSGQFRIEQGIANSILGCHLVRYAELSRPCAGEPCPRDGALLY